MKRKVIYVKPKLIDCYGDLSRVWFVEYQYRNPKTGKLERFRVYKGMGKTCTSEKGRRSAAVEIIKEYIEKLESGWTPFQPDDRIYEDQIDYSNVAKVYSRLKRSNNPIKIHLSEFLANTKIEVSAKTYESYQSKIRLFYQFLELRKISDNDISSISNEIVIGFFKYIITERNLDKLTVEKYKQNINSLCKYLLEKKLIFENPVYNIPIPPKKVDFSAQEILKEDRISLLEIIKKNDPQLYLACLFQYYCATRPGNELRLLKIGQINFHSGLIIIKSTEAKNNKSRVIQLADKFREILIEFGINNYNKEFYVFSRLGVPGADPLGKNTLRNRFNSFRDSLGLSKDYKFYSWKHSGAGALDDINVPLRDIQQHLGHSSAEYTAIYLKRRRGFKNDKIKFDFPDP